MKRQKNGSLIKITGEMMEAVLNLPPDVHIAEVLWDERNIATFKLRSEKPVEGITYPIGEGMVYPAISPSELMMRKMIEFALDFDEMVDTGVFRHMDLLEQIKEERAEQEEDEC